MKQLALAIILACSSTAAYADPPPRQLKQMQDKPVIREELPVEDNTPMTINNQDRVRALINIERGPRPKKWLGLMPGPAVMFYYEWVRSDGSVAKVMKPYKIKGVPCEAPLRDSHPNLAIFIPSAQVTGSAFQTITPFVVKW